MLNLVVNSRDAMPQGGKLTIETTNADLDATYAGQHVSVRPGAYVRLTVTDDGVGMDERTRLRIFEPFFTTKPKDKGTGLGLSTVYGIVKQSGGNIWVYSEPGRGTTFKIHLPRAEGAAAAIPPPPVEASTARAEGTILLVEDNEAVRKLTRKMLQEIGYKILEAQSGEVALRTAAEHPGPIELVLTDVVMPEMSGAKLAARLRKLRPATRFLFMSGYSDEAIVRHDMLRPGSAFLQKPFTLKSLAKRVREVLAGPV
jgi:two-component system cell cycle sensor histidine kinase/response regulator CckA